MKEEYLKIIEEIQKSLSLATEVISKQRELIEIQKIEIDKWKRAGFPERYGEYPLGEALADLMSIKG